MAKNPHGRPRQRTAASSKRESTQSADALPAGRQAGICLHITSLPGVHGIGELGAEACRFIDFLADAGIAVWQVLPTGPTAYGDSPYQPLSTFAGNEMLIDIADLVERGLVSPDEALPLTALPVATIDYGQLVPAKQQVLARAAMRFSDVAPAASQAAFDDFRQRNDATWLHDYAVFRVLKAQHGERPWTEWPRPLRRRERSAVRDVERRLAADVHTVKVLQFLFADQWARLRAHADARGITLFGDMPIYVALDSADAWANRELLRIDRDGRPDRIAGVPPDYFSADGQLWGNPLYDWPYHHANGFQWWVGRLAHAMALTGMVRIDHFRGFEAFWSVPAGDDTARNGHWEPGPGEALFAALEASFGVLPIVAEDLGVITPAVDALRDRHRLPGMRVLQFDVSDEAFSPGNIPEYCVCYTGTHDNDTTAGWFHGDPADTRNDNERERTRQRVLALTGGSARTVHWDLLRLAAECPARLVVAPLQDCLGLGSEARMNTPGTPGGNWRWRVSDDQLSAGLAGRLRALLQAHRRGAAD